MSLIPSVAFKVWIVDYPRPGDVLLEQFSRRRPVDLFCLSWRSETYELIPKYARRKKPWKLIMATPEACVLE